MSEKIKITSGCDKRQEVWQGKIPDLVFPL